jgi:dTDP-4-dehydrorhamnose 3,5-epimerase
MIEGIKIQSLTQIHDERGKVMHMLRNDSPIFEKFGEIYFSITYPGVIKAWHLHKRMTLNYAVVSGALKFVFYDDRKSSSTFGEIQEIFISPENYSLITVPPNIWNGFKAVGPETSILANCSTIPHDPEEILRKPFNDKNIPYKWDIIYK